MYVIGTRLLPWIDRKLYEWEMEGRGLNGEAPWFLARERQGRARGKSRGGCAVSGISRLPKGSRAIRVALA
jgi:hypothetical protein